MMNTLKTMLFIIAIPGSLLIVIPSTILEPIEKNAVNLGFFGWLALPFWLIGLGILAWCAADFVRKGQGTPAPVDAPKQLVVSGLYHFVRNPMYVGVLLFAAGNVLWYGSPVMAGYMLFLWLAFQVFILLYEEPHLRKVFGVEYLEYCQSVPRWLPRFKRSS
jgi:protein-S-isoprenylcysteine O-methyltransferase Ste14